MNYTENYHLPQWEETDRIMRTDFNEAMANIAEGMKNNADAADSYVIGEYIGLGVERKITLGFRPRYLITFGVVAPKNTSEDVIGTVAFLSGTITHLAEFTDDGVILKKPHYNYPHVNVLNRGYGYIAFR